MAYWDQYNPWREKAVYVPLEELAEALADGSTVRLVDGSVVDYTAELMLEHWHRNSFNLDGYILPNDVLGYSVGVRYGSHQDEYLSLHARDRSKIEALYLQYAEAHGLTH
jgi:hypothetical protein